MIYDGNGEYNERDAREHKAADILAAENAEFEYQLEELYSEELAEIGAAIYEIEKRLSRSFLNREGIRDRLFEIIKDGM
jgi:hypothetical protein